METKTDTAAGFNKAMESWNTLSSDGLFGELFGLAKMIGDWAGAASNLIGLVS